MAEFFNLGGMRGMNVPRKNQPLSQFDKLYENLCNFCKKAVEIINKFKEESVKKKGGIKSTLEMEL